MTVSTDLNKIIYEGNDATTEFEFENITIASASELRVFLTEILTGIEGDDLILDTDYTVNVDTYPGDGYVTYPISGAPLPAGHKITIIREVPVTQGTSLGNQATYFPKVQEAAFDKLTKIAQQLKEAIGRTLRFPASDQNITVEIPPSAERAGKVLGFDANGDLLTSDPTMQSLAAAVLQLNMDTFSGDDADTTFDLTYAPAAATGISVYVNNVWQTPDVAYTVEDNTLTFASAPPTGTDNIRVLFHGLEAGAQANLAPDGSASAPGFAFKDDTDTGLYKAGVNSIGFVTGGTLRYTIDSIGNFAGSGNAVIGSSSGPTYLRAPASSSVRLADNTNANVLLADGGGAVGIRNLSPSGAFILDIGENSAGNGASVRLTGGLSGAVAAPTLEFNYADAAADLKRWSLFNGLDGRFVIASRTDAGVGTPRITTLSNGKVGIGTSSPTQLLHVNDGMSSAAIQITSANNYSAQVLMGTATNPTHGRVFYDTVTNAMVINANNAERVRVNSNGDVLPGFTELQDLGSTAKEWDNIFLQNAATVSDRRRKRVQGPVTGALDFLSRIEPVVFTRKDRVIPERVVDGDTVPRQVIKHGRPHTGVIAQQVKDAMTAAGLDDWAGYAYDAETDTHMVRPTEFIAYLIGAVQELDAANKALLDRITVLEEGR